MKLSELKRLTTTLVTKDCRDTRIARDDLMGLMNIAKVAVAIDDNDFQYVSDFTYHLIRTGLLRELREELKGLK